jgi:hypothetical protein
MLGNMMGGGIKSKCKEFGKGKEWYMLGMGAVILLLKTLIVQWTYNKIWPKLTMNLMVSNQELSRFVPLTFYEAFLFVIFIEFLF